MTPEQHLRELAKARRRVDDLDERLTEARAARDLALRAAVTAGVRIADAAPAVGLTYTSARWVLYGRDSQAKTKAAKAKA